MIVTWQVNGEILTLEIPDGTIKEFWDTPDFRTFLSDFRQRHPLAQDLAKKASRSESVEQQSFLHPLPFSKKRPAEELLTIVEVDAVPGGARLLEVPILNARTSGKVDAVPALVISDQGPFLTNTSSVEVPQQNSTLHF